MATGSTLYNYDYGYRDEHTSNRNGWSKNIDAPPGVHIMNKNESTSLRKLKIKTGLSEEELRKEKKYRKILSDAQKEKGTKDRYERSVVNLVKRATSEVKLPVEHPKTKEKIKELLNIHNGYPKLRCFTGVPRVDNIIETYKRIRKNRKK